MIRSHIVVALLASLALPFAAQAAMEQQGDVRWDGSQPPQGVLFHWYEPSFYAGFAPRTQDPNRPHIELSRGNQVRVTLPLGDKEIDDYLPDLVERRKIYQEMIDAGVVKLSTNNEYERFTKGLDDQGVAAAVKPAPGDAASRAKSVEIMKALNPHRIFEIKIPFEPLVAQWHAKLSASGLASEDEKLDVANALLPGRIELYDIDAATDTALSKAASAAKAGGASDPAFRAAAEEFLNVATNGHYPVKNGNVETVEFTTIYPAGTIEGYTSYKGERLPEFGVTGVWPLIKRTTGRGQTGMVDYISPNPGYGYITMYPYQFAGGIAYNAFHNAGVRAPLSSTPFLPAEWRKLAGERDPSKGYQNLWIAARGPTSHGCTRLGSGHMSELRQLTPTGQDALTDLPTYRNQPYCYDVFDIDGDGKAEVMGVQYYLAFRSTQDRIPTAAYAKNSREPFYKWMYGDNIEMGPIGQAKIKEVPVCRFDSKRAELQETLSGIPLHEAEWTPETIQFYTIKGHAPDSGPGFELNREIRKVGAGHTVDRAKLLLK